jgi:hypothetical protein
MSHESKRIGQAPLPKVQGDQAQGRGAHNLLKSKAQAASGLVGSGQNVGVETTYGTY